MSSLFIYSSTFLCSLLFVFFGLKFSHRKSVRYLSLYPYFIALSVPILLASIRIETGTDWLSYSHAYNRILKFVKAPYYITGYLFENKYDFEIGYYLINRAAFLINDQYHTVLFISSALTLLAAFLGILKYKDKLYVLLSWYVFLMLLYAPSYNAIRQSIAVSITILGSVYLYRQKYFKYGIFVLIAALFHRSSIVCLLFPLFIILDKHKVVRLMYYLAIILTPFSTFVIIKIVSNVQFLNSIFEKYQFSYSGGGLGFLIDVLMPSIPLIIFYKKIFSDRGMQLLFNCYLLKVPFRYFAYYVPFLERLMEYTVGIEIILISMLVRKIENKKNQYLVIIFYIVWYALYFLYRYMLINTGHIFPYQC